MRPFLVLLLAFLLALAAPVVARNLTADERAALSSAVLRFENAILARDMAAVIDAVPPRVLQHIAAQAGVEVESLRVMVAEHLAALTQQVTLVSFGMDLDAAVERETSDGTPYVLIPTEFVIESVPGKRMHATGHTLAIMDEGVWYLLRVSEEKNVAILRAVYHSFADVALPEGRIEPFE